MGGGVEMKMWVIILRRAGRFKLVFLFIRQAAAAVMKRQTARWQLRTLCVTANVEQEMLPKAALRPRFHMHK